MGGVKNREEIKPSWCWKHCDCEWFTSNHDPLIKKAFTSALCFVPGTI